MFPGRTQEWKGADVPILLRGWSLTTKPFDWEMRSPPIFSLQALSSPAVVGALSCC